MSGRCRAQYQPRVPSPPAEVIQFVRPHHDTAAGRHHLATGVSASRPDLELDTIVLTQTENGAPELAASVIWSDPEAQELPFWQPPPKNPPDRRAFPSFHRHGDCTFSRRDAGALPTAHTSAGSSRRF